MSAFVAAEFLFFNWFLLILWFCYVDAMNEITQDALRRFDTYLDDA